MTPEQRAGKCYRESSISSRPFDTPKRDLVRTLTADMSTQKSHVSCVSVLERTPFSRVNTWHLGTCPPACQPRVPSPCANLRWGQPSDRLRSGQAAQPVDTTQRQPDARFAFQPLVLLSRHRSHDP